MSQADQIREHVRRYWIAPARARGEGIVTIRAGDVHERMGLRSRIPAVCSALRGEALQKQAGAVLMSHPVPSDGANAVFTYRIVGEGIAPTLAAPVPPAKRVRVASEFQKPSEPRAPNFDGSITLISCVKTKLPRAAAARELYTSSLFTLARNLAERNNARWFVLSALYGLVEPNQVIEPYEKTLLTMSAAERRNWAARVWQQLQPHLSNVQRIVFLAGEAYRGPLAPSIRAAGIVSEAPMKGLRLGEQLSWLGRQP